MEGRALVEAAFNLDLPAMVLDNAVYHRKPHARPLTTLLGGEKRIKNPFLNGLVNTVACVRQRQFNIGSRHQGWYGNCFLGKFDVTQPDLYASLVKADCMGGIDDQVDKYMDKYKSRLRKRNCKFLTDACQYIIQLSFQKFKSFISRC